MQPLYYSTGQAARELGTSLALIRLLCETHAIPAETTPGGHLRVSAAVVERLKREGMPQVPRPLPTETAPPARNATNGHYDHTAYLAEPSDDVVYAAGQVEITRSTLEKRKIERELEENEDWFRERQGRQVAAEVADQQKAEVKLAEQRRHAWVQEWTQYALNSLPSDARRAVEIEVHTAVQETLSALQPNQPEAITRRLVDAAVHRALGPWKRKQDIERALNAGMNRLSWDIQYRRECAPLKQRAWDAAVAALRKVREEASYNEMETAAVEAVQPINREHEHQQACQGIVGRVYISGATIEEREAAKEAVQKALAELPIGAGPRQFEKAEETALAPHKVAVAARKEKVRLDSDRQAKRCAVEWMADLQLDHIARYLDKEFEFDGGYAEMRREADRLRPLIREALIDELVKHPMSPDRIREIIEDQIDDDL